MKNLKINLTFDCFTLKQPIVSSIITKCIETTLAAEGITAPCEINVLVTNDRGIHAINKASRDIDRPTDVLSFPMFELEAGNPPADWEDYLDPETGMCPLGDMCISLERANAQAKEFGHSSRREVGYLTIHSMLHLLGYDHLDEGEMKAQMRAREETIAGMIPGMSRN
jgi:probable rRNA maturation factor